MSNQLLGRGNTVAAVDELYLFLTNMTAIEYIRNGMKRVRKKESSFILASQNIEDFLLPEIKEFTKPLFSIPAHHFLFNPGNISPTAFIDTLQLEESEYSLIKYPERGTCFTGAVTRGICYRSLLLLTRRHCLVRLGEDKTVRNRCGI